MIDWRNFFDQLIKNGFKKYDNIRKIPTSQGHNYITGCLLGYPYFKKYWELIAIDLTNSKN